MRGRDPGGDAAKTTLGWARRWLSEARLQPHADDCDGDVDAALALHEWNLALGKAVMVDVAHFELALRNAYARVLREDDVLRGA